MIAWLAVLLMGGVLGLVGGGGGILSLPILVNFFGMPPSQATGSSLFIIFTAAIVAVAREFNRGNLDRKIALKLGIPASIGSVISRKLIHPVIPDQLFGVTKDNITLFAFGILMAVVAFRMFVPAKTSDQVSIQLLGLTVGLIGGLLGAGGGFLIVPLLTLRLGLEMKTAVPTSLAVIALQSGAGIASDLNHTYPLQNLLAICGVSLLGMLIGLSLRTRLKSEQLKQGFAVLVSIISIFTIFQATLNHFR